MADLLLTPHVIDGEAAFPRPSLMPSRHSSNVDLDVKGVDDPLLLAQISSAMPHLFHHLVGTWAVDVRPSDDYSRWQLALEGAFGRHVWSITSALPDLPDVIAAKLAGFIRAAAEAYARRSAETAAVGTTIEVAAAAATTSTQNTKAQRAIIARSVMHRTPADLAGRQAAA